MGFQIMNHNLQVKKNKKKITIFKLNQKENKKIKM